MHHAKHTHNNASFSLHNVVMQKLIYPLVVTTFLEAQCDAIMHPIIWHGLPKLGMVQTLPWALVYRPLQYRGLAIPNLYMEQLIEQL